MRGLEPQLQSARTFELECINLLSSRMAHSPHQGHSSGTPHPHQLCPLMQQVSGSSWFPKAHAQPCLFYQINLSPTCSARISCFLSPLFPPQPDSPSSILVTHLGSRELCKVPWAHARVQLHGWTWMRSDDCLQPWAQQRKSEGKKTTKVKPQTLAEHRCWSSCDLCQALC